MFKKSIILLSLVSCNAFGYAPPPTFGSMGSDEIRTSDGVTCRSEIGGNIIVYATGYDNNEEGSYNRDDAGVSVGVAYRFGNGNERIDCERIYNQEVKIRDLQIERMQFEIDQLRRAKNINGGIHSGLIPPPPLETN